MTEKVRWMAGRQRRGSETAQFRKQGRRARQGRLVPNPVSLGGLERPRAEDFVLTQGFKGRSRDCGDGDRITHGVEDLDRIPFGAVGGDMAIHQLDDISSTETMLRQVAGERYISVQFKFHRELRLSGTSERTSWTPHNFWVINWPQQAS